MAQYVLVHGAWHGGWCWQRVVQPLAAAGHRVHAPTLTGLGERSHLLSSAITLETHIADVMGVIEAEELQDVILVVHSYAGMLGTAVADRMTARLRRLVYVDAVVPRPGESWSSTHAGTTRAARIASAEASPDYAFAPPDPQVYGLSGADAQWLQRRQTPHPGHTYTAPLAFDAARVGRVPRTFVNCTAPALATIDAIRPRVVDASFWSGHWLPGSDVVELKTGHDPMVSAPAPLCELLTRYA
ncbi:alpha/beta fold hydrolase [Ramlibacter rhizophilus]|uniref:Alpha/beta fold hydrolase n=1 Tax=Ramlibacter rhizophilus TaxID=1781167 RepID=A0A4Z0BAX3_9BURK|nr:alpha/beta fold hydrolase [Ramlibacter rhizophilus]TFY96212.1 alpha/beta fold hydrolase [Ramlibacter rhizophilus]